MQQPKPLTNIIATSYTSKVNKITQPTAEENKQSKQTYPQSTTNKQISNY